VIESRRIGKVEREGPRSETLQPSTAEQTRMV
jgi:hypothetical protein